MDNRTLLPVSILTLGSSVYPTSMILESARIAFALYKTSLPTPVSFIILCVIMITSDAELASSLITRYIICRSEGSLFWKSFEIPKKRLVASLEGKDSPVNIKRAIFVSSMRHFRGDMGELLKSRAGDIL